jgi:hypothetical protein
MENNNSKLEETIKLHLDQIDEYATEILLKKSMANKLMEEIEEFRSLIKAEQYKLDILQGQNEEAFLDIIYKKHI